MTPEVIKQYLQAHLTHYINKKLYRLHHTDDAICTITSNESSSDKEHLKLKYSRESVQILS